MSRTLLLTFSLLFALTRPCHSYVPQMDRNEFGRIVTIKWATTQARSGVRFAVNTSSFPFPESDILRIVSDSFAAWENVASADVRFIDEGTGSFAKSDTDRHNVIVYDSTGFDIGAPPDAKVIAITTINWDNLGNIVDADITFNGRDFDFSASSAPNTRPNLVDLQDTMTHEIGHLLGLDHTPLTGSVSERPTMHPFSSPTGAGRSLADDDIAGLTFLYPGPGATSLGTVTGTVERENGTASFGVNVVAYDATSGSFVANSLSGSCGDQTGPNGDGRYEIAGLPPGDYHIGIEPIQSPVSEDNIGGIFSDLDRNFSAEFYNNALTRNAAQFVRVDAGRVAANIDFVFGFSAPGSPLVAERSFPQNTPDTGGPYTVQVVVTDDDVVASVILLYRVAGGSEIEVTMQSVDGDLWEASIPGQARGTLITYRIAAVDVADNKTVLPPIESNPLSFEVLSFSGQPLIYVVESGSDVVSVIDSGARREVARIPTGIRPHSIAMTPDETLLFVANTGTPSTPSRSLTVIETATHRRVADITVGLGPLDLAINQSGTRLFVTNSDARSLSVVDASELRELQRIALGVVSNGPFGVAVQADGNTAYTTNIDADQVIVTDVPSSQVIDVISVVASPRSLVLSTAGDRLYVTGFEGGVGIVDTQTRQQIRTIDTPAGTFRIAVSPTRNVIYATDQDSDLLLEMDPDAGRVLRSAPALFSGDNSRGLAVSADGSLVYVTNQDSNDLVVFDAESLSIVDSYTLGDGPRGIAIRRQPFDQPVQIDQIALADFNRDGFVGFSDFLLFAAVFGSAVGDPLFEARFDLTDDNRVDFPDFILFASVFGRPVV